MEQVHCLKWFLVQLKPNSAQIAKRNLERQGFRVFNPNRLITKRASSKFVDKHEQLFPGYMFMSFDPEDGRWQAINSTFGVARLVQFGSMPKYLPISLMTALMRRFSDMNLSQSQQAIQQNDTVRVLHGPFAEFLAYVEKVDGQKRVWLLIDLLGRQTRIAADPQTLAKVG